MDDNQESNNNGDSETIDDNHLANNDEVIEPDYDSEQLNRILMQHSRSVSGPIPSATEMQLYADIDISIVDRIITMAEKESAHRHHQENTALEYQARDNRTGQHYALFMGLAGFTVAIIAVYLNAPWIGAILGGGTLTLLVTAFLKK